MMQRCSSSVGQAQQPLQASQYCSSRLQTAAVTPSRPTVHRNAQPQQQQATDCSTCSALVPGGSSNVSVSRSLSSFQAGAQRDGTPAGDSTVRHRSSRRAALGGLLCAPAVISGLAAALVMQRAEPAAAVEIPNQGFRVHVDKLDGYTFEYPEVWTAITSSGNDVFLRNPYNIDENLFVDITSASSSRFESVSDLGSPEDAAKKFLDQLLKREFMSTRIGIRREGEVVTAAARTGADGKLYYDIDVRMKSFASRNPYVSSPAEVMRDYGLEWDRRLVTVLGVANQRLYSMRLQTSSKAYEKSSDVLRGIMNSFEVKEVEA